MKNKQLRDKIVAILGGKQELNWAEASESVASALNIFLADHNLVAIVTIQNQVCGKDES